MHIKDHVDPHNCGVNGWADSPGWYYLLEDLNEQLEAIDPDYTWVQIKQKFCNLRFYAGKHSKTLCGCTSVSDCRFQTAILHASIKSNGICEICGVGVPRGTNFGTVRCEECETDESDPRWLRWEKYRKMVMNPIPASVMVAVNDAS